MKTMNTPTLRFKEFSGAWEVKKLGDIATFSKGKGISKADIDENGKTFCIRYGELYTEYGETINKVKSKTNVHVDNLALSEINDVIIPASGETQIDIATASCVQVAGVALGGDLNIIKSKENGVFLTYYLNNQKKLEIAKLAQGNSVVHLYSSQLKLLALNLPDKKEQTKIANFLTAIDEKIAQLSQTAQLLTDYKKGVMQQIFSQQLRFKDDDGREFAEWEEKSLGEVGNFIGGGTPSTQNLDWWNGNVPWISSSDLTEQSIHKINVTRFISEAAISQSATKLVPKNSVLIVSRVGVGKVAVNDADICTSQDFTSLVPYSGNSFFLAYLLKLKTKNLLEFNQGTSIKGFVKSDLEELKISLPCVEEQTKIANFLTAIDDKINHNQTQLDAMKQYKSGLLQQMFV